MRILPSTVATHIFEPAVTGANVVPQLGKRPALHIWPASWSSWVECRLCSGFLPSRSPPARSIIAGDQLSGWKVESMALKPYRKPYCEIFYHGSVSATGDPAPLVPAALQGPGINEVATDPQPDVSCSSNDPGPQPSSHDAATALRSSALLPTGTWRTQGNCATLTNYTLATPASLNTVYNATGLVIVITVQRFFWCVTSYQTEAYSLQQRSSTASADLFPFRGGDDRAPGWLSACASAFEPSVCAGTTF